MNKYIFIGEIIRLDTVVALWKQDEKPQTGYALYTVCTNTWIYSEQMAKPIGWVSKTAKLNDGYVNNFIDRHTLVLWWAIKLEQYAALCLFILLSISQKTMQSKRKHPLFGRRFKCTCVWCAYALPLRAKPQSDTFRICEAPWSSLLFYLLFYQHHHFGSVYIFSHGKPSSVRSIGQIGCRQTGTQTPYNASIRDCTMSMLFYFQRFMTIVELCILCPSFRTHPKLKLKLVVCGSFVCQPLNNLCIACANNDIATLQSLLVT